MRYRPSADTTDDHLIASIYGCLVSSKSWFRVASPVRVVELERFGPLPRQKSSASTRNTRNQAHCQGARHRSSQSMAGLTFPKSGLKLLACRCLRDNRNDSGRAEMVVSKALGRNYRISMLNFGTSGCSRIAILKLKWAYRVRLQCPLHMGWHIASPGHLHRNGC